MSNLRYQSVFVLMILAIGSPALAQVASILPSESIVTARAVLSAAKLRSGGSFSLAIKATVAKGYHIGAHDKEALYPAKLTVHAPDGITFEEPVFPNARWLALKIAPGERIPVYTGQFVIRVKGQVAKDFKAGPVTIISKLDTQACTDDQCLPPRISNIRLKTEVVATDVALKQTNSSASSSPAETKDAAGRMADRLASTNTGLRFLLLYIGGLLLAFTPCVYPMVPVTVGYFSNQSGNKQKVILLASAYVFGLALTYSLLGMAASASHEVFGSAMQNPAVLLGVAGILVVLALSMFGLYEIRPPGFIQNRASSRSGIVGAFVMGAVFGIVCAPCVGPMVLGLLIFAAKLGNPVVGFLMFFALALGIGTPLFFLAAFSARIPVPGMWMVAIKKLAGFLLIGAASYFVLPILPQSIGRLLMPLVILIAGVYLGFFEASVRSRVATASVGRIFGIAAVAVAATMIFPVVQLQTGATSHHQRSSVRWEPYEADRVTQAVKMHKPIMVDFTAEWCGACQEMERGPFSDPKIIEATQRFARFRVDGTNRSDQKMLTVVKKFRVQGFPTVVFLDSLGKEITAARVIGFTESKKLMKQIELVR